MVASSYQPLSSLARPDSLPCRLCARLGRRLNARRWLVVLACVGVICFYYQHVSNSGPSRPKMKTLLRPKNFCPSSNLSSPSPDDLTYWGSPPSTTERSNVRILLFS